MANWNILKTAVADVINTNGNQEITGQLLQNVLNNIITNVGENATFAGIATLNTNPGTPDGPVFYLATTVGVYPNFNGLEVLNSEAVIFLWNNSAWTKKVTGFATNEKLSQLWKEVVNAVNEKLSQLGKEVNANRYGYNVTINGLIGGVHNIESAINDVPSKYRMLGQKITFRTENGDWATYHNESLSLDSYTDVNDWKQDTGIGQVMGDVNIKNEPDYEDLTESKDNKLKFADKEYNYDSNSGLGRVYLRKNVVGDANVLTQEMISKSNTEYIIQYDYDLQGENITIPENCVLNFSGGSLKNGSVNGDNVQIVNKLNNCILNRVNGNYKIQKAPFSWFMYEEKDNIVDSINFALEHTHHLLIEEGVYYIHKTIRPQSNQTIEGQGKVVLVSEIKAYDYNTNAEKDGSIVNVALVAVRGLEDGVDYSKYPSASGDYVYGKGIALAPNNVYNQNYVIVAKENEISNIHSGDWLLVSSGLGYWHYVVQEMAMVDYVEGNYIYFKNTLRYSYSTERYSLSNWYKEYDIVAQPGGTTVGYPDFSTFETCCVRKITPKENILIKNVVLDISSNGSVSNLGLLIMLGRNIRTDNVEIINGRLWTCDSQDVRHSCIKTNYNSYIGNGSNNINAYQCEFNEGLQIEEGCTDCLLTSCVGTSSSTVNSIIGSSKNISLVFCRFAYQKENNSCFSVKKSKVISFVNCNIGGGSSSISITDPAWSSKENNPLEIEGYKDLKELTDFYTSDILIIGGTLNSYGKQTSLYNGSIRYAEVKGTDIANLSATMNVLGSYSSNGKTFNVVKGLSTKGDISVNGGKSHVQGLLNLSAQLNMEVQRAISRGLWAGESNGGGSEIEGSKSWTALGVRNQGDENTLLKNNTEFGLFHLNNEDFLRFKMGAGQYYRMILNDGSVPNFTAEKTPSVDRYGVGVPLFMSDKQRPVYKAFRYENGEIVENSYYGYDGYSYLYNRVGFTEERPFPNSRDAGFRYYDKTLNKPIWWTGSKWVDATGASV